MIKTDKPSLTYKSLKKDFSILIREIIDLAIENSDLNYSFKGNNTRARFSLIYLDVKNCKIVFPDCENCKLDEYSTQSNYNKNLIMLGYIDDYCFTLLEQENKHFKIKANKDELKAELYLKLLNFDNEKDLTFGSDLESKFYQKILKIFGTLKNKEFFEVLLEDCFPSYSFLSWISGSKMASNHPLLRYYFNLFLGQLDSMDFNNIPMMPNHYKIQTLLYLSKNYLTKKDRCFLQEKIIEVILKKNNFNNEINHPEIFSDLFCNIYRNIDGIDLKKFFELINLEKVNFNFIYKISEFIKEDDFVEFLQLIESKTIKFDNSDSFKLFISKNSYGSINEIRNKINFIFEVINRISSTKKKINILISISSEFEEFELQIIEDLLEPIYKLRSKKLIKLEKV